MVDKIVVYLINFVIGSNELGNYIVGVNWG